MDIQDFGETFDLSKFYHARDVTHELYKEISKHQDVEKNWHPPKLRFGPNTLKTFKEPSDPYILQDEDILYIDIGPVIDGHELYRWAETRAQELGYKLNMGSDGHRIGDFPHHVFFKGAIIECDEELLPHAWILEIQLDHPKLKFGAFYEDILS